MIIIRNIQRKGNCMGKSKRLLGLYTNIYDPNKIVEVKQIRNGYAFGTLTEDYPPHPESYGFRETIEELQTNYVKEDE
jgi:hypothetical protein